MNNKNLIRLSTVMSLICAVLIFVLPLGVLWFWLNFESNAQFLAISEHRTLQLETIKTWQIVCSAIYSMGSTLVIVYGLNQLRHLFNNFKSGYFFTETSIHSMHGFSIALFISAVLRSLNTMVLSVLLTFNHGPDQKALVISFGSNEFWALFIAATFLAITWCFKEGLHLTNENASFV